METKTCPDCGCTTTPNNYKRHIGSKQCLLNQQNEKSKIVYSNAIYYW